MKSGDGPDERSVKETCHDGESEPAVGLVNQPMGGPRSPRVRSKLRTWVASGSSGAQ